MPASRPRAQSRGQVGSTGLTRVLAVESATAASREHHLAGAIETARPASAGVSAAADMMPPVPRRGSVEEIASAALFLAHPDQAYITGQIIHVNGGAYLGT